MSANEPIQEAVKQTGLATCQRHIFLCADQTKPKCCSKEDSLRSWDFLKARLKELGLASPGGPHLQNQGQLPATLPERSCGGGLS